MVIDIFSSPIFSFLSASILLCCLLVITSSSAVTSVIYLIFTFVLVAFYLCSLNLHYLGLTYIIIYVGAIMVLLLFVIMIMNLNHYGDFDSSNLITGGSKFSQTLPLIIFAALIYGYIIVKGTGSPYHLDSNPIFSSQDSFKNLFQAGGWFDQLIFSNSDHLSFLSPSNYLDFFSDLPQSSLYLSGSSSIIQSIALELYTHQAIWLIIISLVLIISMIGPIVICKIS